MAKFKNVLLLSAICLSIIPKEHDGFYVPGVAPVEFKVGDKIEVKAVKLTSVRTQLPYEYYSLPFCRPEEGKLHFKTENLGEILRGDRIVNTPFTLKMKTDSACQLLCNSPENPLKLSKEETKTLLQRIREEYYVNLLVDNLPCATKIKTPDNSEEFYDHGYKLGYFADKRVYVHNHLHFKMKYHEHTEGQFRVVGFEVEPRSVNWKELKFEKSACVAKSGQWDNLPPLQLEEGENQILWTYSVQWENSDIKWASRWDTYLAMKDVQIHWFSIVNSTIVVFCLAGFLSIIIVRTVRRDIANYNREDDLDETLEETGWKLVHGDVFRPPSNSKLLVSLIGSGIQIFGMSLVTVCFAMLGMLSPSSRGSLMTCALFLYCFMGLVAGYYAGRLYKTLRGVQWKKAALQTGIIFPAIFFGTGFVLNFFIWGKHSSGAVPFTTMLALIAMWFGIDVPLVFTGFYFGFRKQPYEHPVRTNQIPRQVPEQPWYLHCLVSSALAGILPFGAMFIELFFIFSAIWENQFYYLFGFLFLVFVILVVSCGLIAIVVTYFQLCAESYRWWWRSYFIGGSSAFYVFAYSVFYFFTKLEIIGFIPTLLYFGYSFLIALTFWLFAGTIGFFATYFFVRKIYSAVKID